MSFRKKHYQATKRLASRDFELTTKVNFLSKLQNPRITNKVAQSKEFQNYDQFSLQHCFKKALELEGTYQLSEGVNMVQSTSALHLDHKCDSEYELCEMNQVGWDNKAKNNICWKCRDVGHFACKCPQCNKDNIVTDKFAGRILHTYLGSTPVTERMLRELMEGAINATASNIIITREYKQMKRYKKTLKH